MTSLPRRTGTRNVERLVFVLTLASLLMAGCGSLGGAAPPVTASSGVVGVASYYADSLAGRPTASGEPYDPRRHTCAHRRLPFGTRVRVTVLDTGASATCVINDRGPFVKGRVIDVSRAVAKKLGLLERGIARVRVEPI